MKEDFEKLFESLKREITEETLVETGDGLKKGIDVTLGFTYNEENEFLWDWDYQAGDNSFFGAAYGHPNWATVTVFPRSDCRDLVEDVLEQVSNFPVVLNGAES
jgi:hypothetical protein